MNTYDSIIQATGIRDGEYAGFAGGSADNRWIVPFKDMYSFLCDPRLYEQNFWFNCSAMDGRGSCKANCIGTGSIAADIDYGIEGHRKPSPFVTMEEALAHVYSIPVKPSFVSCSGHGLQPIYLLREKCIYADKSLEVFHEAKRRLYHALRSDCTSSPAAMFRVPGSVNDKSRLFPGLPIVRSYIVQPLDLSVRYSPQEIVDLLPPVPRRMSPRVVSHSPATEVKVPSDYASIPQWLRTILDSEHPAGTRSEAFYNTVWALHNLGFGNQDIAAVLGPLPWIPVRYASRLSAEIERCLSKSFIEDDETVVYPKPLNRIVRLEVP